MHKIFSEKHSGIITPSPSRPQKRYFLLMCMNLILLSCMSSSVATAHLITATKVGKENKYLNSPS
jgi:hypothetical protein